MAISRSKDLFIPKRIRNKIMLQTNIPDSATLFLQKPLPRVGRLIYQNECLDKAIYPIIID